MPEEKKEFKVYNSNFVMIDALLSWSSNRFGHILVEHHPRKTGVSNYNLPKLIAHSVNMVVSFSVTPLRIASFLGFAFMMLGAAIFCYIIISYLAGDSAVAGFTFLASSITIFSGVQLFCLGIVGEYMSRIYMRSMSRPVSLIRSTAGVHDV